MPPLRSNGMRIFDWMSGKRSERNRLKEENKKLDDTVSSLLCELKEANAKYDYQTAKLEKK